MAGRAAPAPRQPAAADDCKVLVFGYPGYTQPQDLTRALVHFGNVRVEKMSHKYATLSFPTSIEAKSALKASKQVSIYGMLLTVKPFDPNMPVEAKRSPKKEKKNKEILPSMDPHKIDLSGDFHEQLDRILVYVRLTQQDVARISALYSDLERVLRAPWPDCTAIPFGSIPTGLGIKSSDADCFVRLPPAARHPSANYVMKAKRVLAQHPALFSGVLAIPRANTPIVKFLHIPTGTNCDLTFKTELGARNSRLIAFLLHADPRLLPMAVVIKYWAKIHELSGSGRLTNYALTMLVIFYLQQPEVAILPSVLWLQSRVQEDIIDFWNVAFDDQKDRLPPINNRSSLSELIGGFFEYYDRFNFEELVVCPYLGYPIKKDVFKDLNTVPPGFERYKDNVRSESVLPIRFSTSICVQDPFEQCHNVASTISSRLAEDLNAYIKFAAESYQQEKPNDCKRFFQTILLEKPKIVRPKGSPEFRVNLFPNMIASIEATDWKAVVRKIVFEIFETMLKIKLGKVEEKINPDSKKEKEKYMGAVTKAIWKRKQYNRLCSIMNLDFVEKNTKITEEILNTEKDSVNIQFQLTLTFTHEPRSSVISVKNSRGDVAAFREFGKFVASVVPIWYGHLVKPFARWPETDSRAKLAETMKCLDSNMNAKRAGPSAPPRSPPP